MDKSMVTQLTSGVCYQLFKLFVYLSNYNNNCDIQFIDVKSQHFIQSLQVWAKTILRAPTASLAILRAASKRTPLKIFKSGLHAIFGDSDLSTNCFFLNNL